MPLRPIEQDPEDGIAFLVMRRAAFDEDTHAVALVEGEEAVREMILDLQAMASDDFYYYACQVVAPESFPERWFAS